MTSVARAILENLERWQEGFWSLARVDLCRLTGCSAREVRAGVAELRRQGYLIVTAPGGGYRIAKSEAEVTEFTAALQQRIRSLTAVIEAMEAKAAEQFGNGC